MAWTVPVDFSTGRLVSAPDWNAEMGTSGNMSLTAVALASAAGQIPYATATNTLAMLEIGAANRVLTSTGSAPQWSDSLALGGNVSLGGASNRSALDHSGTVLLHGVGSTWTEQRWYTAATQRASLTNSALALTVDLTAHSNTAYAKYVLAHGGLGTTTAATTTVPLEMRANSASFNAAMLWRDEGGGADAKNWLWYLNANQIQLSTVNDAFNAESPGIRFNRSGNTWTDISLGTHQKFITDNAHDIGASGATRPRRIYVADYVEFRVASGGSAGVATTGVIRLGQGSPATSGIFARNAANGADIALLSMTGSDDVQLGGSGAAYVRLNSGASGNAVIWQQSVAAFYPDTDSSSAGTGYDLGRATFRWRDAYVWRAAFNGSLRASKRNATLVDRDAALRVARSTKIRRYQYKPGGPDDVNAERWHIGFYADDAHPWLSDDRVHASPATTASLALAAVAGEADAREADVAALKAEIAQLRAELKNRRN